MIQEEDTTMTNNKVINILIERDNLTEAEATNVLNETRKAINDEIASGNISDVEDIIADYLGLEMDYIFDILY